MASRQGRVTSLRASCGGGCCKVQCPPACEEVRHACLPPCMLPLHAGSAVACPLRLTVRWLCSPDAISWALGVGAQLTSAGGQPSAGIVLADCRYWEPATGLARLEPCASPQGSSTTLSDSAKIHESCKRILRQQCFLYLCASASLETILSLKLKRLR